MHLTRQSSQTAASVNEKGFDGLSRKLTRFESSKRINEYVVNYDHSWTLVVSAIVSTAILLNRILSKINNTNKIMPDLKMKWRRALTAFQVPISMYNEFILI